MIDTDRLDEQKRELQILESIYLDDLEMTTGMSPFKFSIQIGPYLQDYEMEQYNNEMDCKLQFEMGRNYPIEPPKVRVIAMNHNYESEYFEIDEKVQRVYEQTDKYRQSCFIYQIVEVMRVFI